MKCETEESLVLDTLYQQLNELITSESDRLYELGPNSVEAAELLAEINNAKLVLSERGVEYKREFFPNHVLTLCHKEPAVDGSVRIIKDYFLMVVNGLAYTKEEWMNCSSPEWSLSREGTWEGHGGKVHKGTWCFNGKPFQEDGVRLAAGKCRKVCTIKKDFPTQTLQQWYDNYTACQN